MWCLPHPLLNSFWAASARQISRKARQKAAAGIFLLSGRDSGFAAVDLKTNFDEDPPEL